MNRRLPCLVSMCSLMALAGTAMAQEKVDEPAPLKGPAVKQDRIPGVEQGFVPGKQRGALGGGDRGVPQRVFMEAIAELRADSAPEGLALTAEQQEAIAGLNDEFKRSTREFAEKMRKELGPDAERSLRRPQPDQRPDQKDQMAGPEADRKPSPEMMEKMQELKRNAPNPTDWQTKIYTHLTEPQKKFVLGRIEDHTKQLEAKRAEEYVQKRLKAAGADGKPADARPGAPGGPDMQRDRMRRILERIAQLPPEERERLLNRLEEALQDRAGDRATDRPAGDRQGGRKPPPKIDDVDVPKPGGEIR